MCKQALKGCSLGTNANATYLSQLMGCTGFSVVVTITEHLH